VELAHGHLSPSDARVAGLLMLVTSRITQLVEPLSRPKITDWPEVEGVPAGKAPHGGKAATGEGDAWRAPEGVTVGTT
jgi:hypothetical protein